MSEMIWFNGEVMPFAEARVGVEDRGFQFADGVYEVVRFYAGKPFTLREHLERLERSAAAISMKVPMGIDELAGEIRKFIDRSGVREGMVYLQLTRGCCPRNHVFPRDVGATLLFYVRELAPILEPGGSEGVKLKSVADERWRRCWIKSIALLANVLAKNEAIAAGCDEAVFVENGIITECSASNIFAVINGKLVTHPVGSRVLPGITRMKVIRCAEELGIEVDERVLREEEAIRAEELFITSTTREIGWVARYNDRYIGQGRCGPTTKKLHVAFQEKVRAETLGGR
jgi:D-alanine transaminase